MAIVLPSLLFLLLALVLVTGDIVQALPPDPHRFDGDKDGVGCER